MAAATTHTIDAPGCTLTYDVHGDPTTDVPLFMLASPMDAAGFVTLRTYFEDRPVITYDPRGAGRSPRTDGADENQVLEHADDIRLILDALDVEQVDVFASSGGATNMLALLGQGPAPLRTVVAHEPPMAAYLPDRDTLVSTTDKIRELYYRDGLGPAIAKFLDVTMLTGPLPDDFAERPPSDPASFGLPTADDGSRDDPMVGLNIRTTLSFEPDLEALRQTSARLVIAFGQESREEMTGRSPRALAEQLDLPATEFPSHHAGFLGGEYGQSGDPEAFAARLREVLDEPVEA